MQQCICSKRRNAWEIDSTLNVEASQKTSHKITLEMFSTNSKTKSIAFTLNKKRKKRKNINDVISDLIQIPLHFFWIILNFLCITRTFHKIIFYYFAYFFLQFSTKHTCHHHIILLLWSFIHNSIDCILCWFLILVWYICWLCKDKP